MEVGGLSIEWRNLSASRSHKANAFLCWHDIGFSLVKQGKEEGVLVASVGGFG